MSLITCVICIQSLIPTSNSLVEIKVIVYTEPRIVKEIKNTEKSVIDASKRGEKSKLMESRMSILTSGLEMNKEEIEQNKTEEFRKEVKILKNIFQNSPEFCEILCDVNIDLAKKYSMIDKILASVNSDILSFVKVIIKNNRAHYLYKIFKETLYRFDDYLEIQEGKLILSKEMSAKKKEKIIKSIEKNEGVRLELEEVIDPSILGGFIVTLKDNVYDASLKTKLQNLKESLKN